MPLAPGTMLGNYTITALIGVGGMGEVYRATDRRLGRDVALKVISPDAAARPDRLERFQREAKALAAIDHQNIVTVFSVEHVADVHFLTMQLVEGDPLERVIPSGGLRVEQVVDIAIAIAEALAAAHSKGIIHRDLKPANVMISSDRRVKVLDFGLAKELRAGAPADTTHTSDGHTQQGVIMGTPAYMSPEQIAGRAIDHRSDIFSLGILLYQMVSGQRPFAGASSIELASSILRDTPRPITELRPDLPAELVRLIRRCLDKDPANRIQTTRDVVRDLRDLKTTTSAVGPAAIARASAATESGSTRQDEGFWLAVLPFHCASGNADVAALAVGLSDEIVTGLSRFSYLRVVARGATRTTSTQQDIRITAQELGARYVLEGSLRHAGSTVRVSVQLIDATTGGHLWAETYDRPLQPDQIFALQDDLIPRIVSTCADTFGALARSISDAVRGKDPKQLTPYEAVMRGFGYHHRLSPGEHAEARAALEHAVQVAPANADCWAMLSWVYSHEYAHGFNPQPGSLDRALTAARKAVEIAPTNHLAYQALAVALFFRKETSACLPAAERAITLNPLDASNEAFFLIFFCGDWDRGRALIRRAMELNPHHPGWYEATLAIDNYRLRNYDEAIRDVMKGSAPGVFWTHLLLAAAYAQRGSAIEARKALDDLLAQKPDFAANGRELLAKWFADDLVDHVVDGLRKAGLEEERSPTSSPSGESQSRRVRPDDSFRVAVLPFRCRGTHPSLELLADGMTEDIITGLSRFTYLRVMAKNSIARHSADGGDLRAIGHELGARYVMDGSIRQAGNSCRVTVQLVDVISGAHLWAESFDRAFQPDEIFALMDQVVPRVVSTVADQHGVLVHSMSAAIRNRRDVDLSPHEAALCVFGFHERMTRDEHARVRTILERAVEQAPDDSDCWAMLATLYTDEHMFGFNALPDPLGRAQAAARRAVELSPSSALASQALAQSLFFRRELDACRPVAERTIALNPMDGAISAFMGLLLALCGDWDRGCAAAEHARKLNPHFPGWYWLPPLFRAMHDADYRAVISFALRVNIPGYFWVPAATAAAHGHLGEAAAAQKALNELLSIRPDFLATAHTEFEKWFQPDLVANWVDGLRKANARRAP